MGRPISSFIRIALFPMVVSWPLQFSPDAFLYSVYGWRPLCLDVWPGTWLFWRRPEPVTGLVLPWLLPRCPTWFGGWRWCWGWCQGSLKLVPPVAATEIESFNEPRIRVLGVMPRRPLLLDLGLSLDLGCPFLFLPLLELLGKLTDPLVGHTLLLHLLQDGFHL